MKKIPVEWTFSRSNVLPIVNVKGESEVAEAEKFLLITATQIIEGASKSFEGVPYVDESQKHLIITKKCTVYFSLIFPSEKNFKNFERGISKLLG